MATAGRLNVPIWKIMRDNLTLTVEMHVTGIRWMKFRLWAGSHIMRLAASVIGCGIEIKTLP